MKKAAKLWLVFLLLCVTGTVSAQSVVPGAGFRAVPQATAPNAFTPGTCGTGQPCVGMWSPNAGSNIDLPVWQTSSSEQLAMWLPSQLGNAGKFLTTDGSAPSWTTVTGGVTSVGLALPVSVFSISGSPVTSSGTLTGSFVNQSANTVFAGPTTGGASTPAFRALVAADLPSGTGTVTQVNTDATLTGGPITTTGTLGINLSHANTWLATQTFPNGSITNAELANSSITASAGAGLTGGGTVSLGGSVSIAMPNVGPGAGTYGGGGLAIASVTLDNQGRMTAVTTYTPSVLSASINAGQVVYATSTSAIASQSNNAWDSTNFIQTIEHDNLGSSLADAFKILNATLASVGTPSQQTGAFHLNGQGYNGSASVSSDVYLFESSAVVTGSHTAQILNFQSREAANTPGLRAQLVTNLPTDNYFLVNDAVSGTQSLIGIWNTSEIGSTNNHGFVGTGTSGTDFVIRTANTGRVLVTSTGSVQFGPNQNDFLYDASNHYTRVIELEAAASSTTLLLGTNTTPTAAITLGNSANTLAINAKVNADVTFSNSGNRQITMQTAGTDTAGLNVTLSAGSAGPVSAAGGKAAGVLAFTTPTGVAGTGALAAGPGGNYTITTGSGGTNNGGGGAANGTVTITLGTPTGANNPTPMQIIGIGSTAVGGPLVLTGNSVSNIGPGIVLDAATNNGGHRWQLMAGGTSAGCGTGNVCFFDVTRGVYTMTVDTSGNFGNQRASSQGGAINMNNSSTTPPASIYTIGGNIEVDTISTPLQPGVTVNTTGAATCTYHLVYVDRNGAMTLAGPQRTVANCAAGASINNTVQTNASPNFSAATVKIIRDAGGTSTGLIATVTGAATISTTDNNLTASAWTDPTYNATGEFKSGGANGLGSVITARVVSEGSPPTITAGTGAGTGPTVSVAGNDMACNVSVITGTTPSASATVATVNFNQPYSAAPVGTQCFPTNAAAAALSGTGAVYVSSTTTNGFVMTVGSSALGAGPYTWFCNTTW